MIKDRDSNGRIPQIWDVDSAVEESKKYKTKKEFREKARSAYQYLVRHKKIHLVNLSGKRHRLSDFDIFCAIKASKTWGEFRFERPKEYTAFHKRKNSIPSCVYEHLGRSKTSKYWTKKRIILEAKKYRYKNEFMRCSPGAYDAALKMGVWAEASSHMEPIHSDYDCIYVWTAKKLKRKRLIKVGVTSKRLGLTRIKFVESKSGMKASEIVIFDCDCATRKEVEIKKIGKKADLNKFSGSTEFYWVTNNQYQKILKEIKNEAT